MENDANNYGCINIDALVRMINTLPSEICVNFFELRLADGTNITINNRFESQAGGPVRAARL